VALVERGSGSTVARDVLGVVLVAADLHRPAVDAEGLSSHGDRIGVRQAGHV
jgi:hypothetical protein